MVENLGVFDFALSREEEEALDALTTPESLQVRKREREREREIAHHA
jgi:diketogulonate reductase-like aldo/keto reductase